MYITTRISDDMLCTRKKLCFDCWEPVSQKYLRYFHLIILRKKSVQKREKRGRGQKHTLPPFQVARPPAAPCDYASGYSRNRTHGECVLSARDAYSSYAYDPTSGTSRSFSDLFYGADHSSLYIAIFFAIILGNKVISVGFFSLLSIRSDYWNLITYQEKQTKLWSHTI
jgi:hypothetical protein